MPIGFNSIPGNIRAPIIAFEVNSGGQFESVSRLLLIGHKNTDADLVDSVPARCNSDVEAIAIAGKGSMLAEMMIAARRNAPAQDIWLLSTPAVGVAEVRTITVGTLPAAGGTGMLTVAGEPIALTMGAGDTAAAVATALAAAINGYQNALTRSALPFTATSATNVVTLTARHAGAIANDIDVFIPTLTTGNAFTSVLTLATTTAGTGEPDTSAALAAMGDDPFDWIVSPFGDDANMDRYRSVLSDVSGRWAWNRQSYGHVYTQRSGTTAVLTTFGLSFDTRHITVLPRLTGGTDGATPWAYVAAVAARVTPWLSDGALGNVSRNQTGLVVEGVVAPRDRTKWVNDYASRDSFIGSGLSTLTVRSDGQVAIDKLVTMQRTDGAGNVDTTFRDLQKIGQLMYALRRFRARLQAEHGQKAIADSNPGDLLAITTAQDIKATMIATAAEMAGVLENIGEFAQRLDLRRNADNPNRVDIYAPLDMINPLDVIAANATIYSQYRAFSAAA
ncbi:tail sheath protein [Aureimonas sp. SA4125]|uniref:phage tail sheath subtilisin-like domain-containing protein n=1 Tax=Aureimonas sp. SA4125 TaxID=2826993 RepID=UPI001CC44152|nr:phage tail sheath subtilisin-like domain-containing protein [Aureimonas sp. SA4125]BDA84970.1 tail sheath protein [Aureimonas sp. SA4125]